MNEIFTGKKHIALGPMKFMMDNSIYFTEVITACVQPERDKRPSASQIEDYFDKFDKIFWHTVKKTGIKYLRNMPKEEKDKVFDLIYRAILEKFPFKI